MEQRQFLLDIDEPIDGSTKICMDNQSNIRLGQNPEFRKITEKFQDPTYTAFTIKCRMPIVTKVLPKQRL